MEQNYLVHHGVKGQKWGVRRFQNEDGSLTSKGRKRYDSETFTASNGTKVAPAKNAYVKVMRKVVAGSGRAGERVYQKNMQKKHADTADNALAIAKGRKQIRNEAQALREYHAHQKDVRKGTGDKYLNKAVRKNAIDNAYDKVTGNSTRYERLVYNNATRKKAAKYIVDNKMTVAEANKKSKQVALRNTAAFMAAYGAITYAQLRSMR